MNLGNIINKVSYQTKQITIEATVMDRGNPLGKWSGSSYEFDTLNRKLAGTGISLIIIIKKN